MPLARNLPSHAVSNCCNDALTEAASRSQGLYVHFPWCLKKCPYCDFNSHPLRGALDESAYIDALIREFRAKAGRRRFDTLFLGGGTPNLFSSEALATLLRTLQQHLAADAEITMEANPGAGERQDFAACRSIGINRLSIGAQSFSRKMLRRLGRLHGPEEIGQCVAAARRGGFDNLNLDLMYALPGQGPEQALADLRQAIALAPEHLSWYQLAIEPKTEFARRPPRNLPGEAAICAMEEAGRALLAEAGFERYEISAYARPGLQCRHNLIYWTFGDYLGLGAGAQGKRSAPQGVARSRNPRSPRLYLANPSGAVAESVAPADLPGEFMLNALRLTAGVRRSLFQARTGLPWSAVAPIWQQTTALGLTQPNRIAATPFGLQRLDSVLGHFV